MKPGPFINNPRSRQQQGAALLVVMMVLLILTLLGIASLRGGIMQERMAANIATRSMSFQVDEAGLHPSSEARRVGKECVVTFRSGCSDYHLRQQKMKYNIGRHYYSKKIKTY